MNEQSFMPLFVRCRDKVSQPSGAKLEVFMTKLLREKVTVSCWIPILLLSCIRVFAGGSNDIPAWFIKPGSVWGDETNRVCAVVELQGRQDSQQVTAFLVSSDTNANWQYVAPPKVKFTKVELRDTNGVVVNPVPGRRLDGNLPARIPIKELPRNPKNW